MGTGILDRQDHPRAFHRLELMQFRAQHFGAGRGQHLDERFPRLGIIFNHEDPNALQIERRSGRAP